MNRAERRRLGFRGPAYAPTPTGTPRIARRAIPRLIDPERPKGTRRFRKAVATLNRIATKYGAY